jgi:hypothetical protein
MIAAAAALCAVMRANGFERAAIVEAISWS